MAGEEIGAIAKSPTPVKSVQTKQGQMNFFEALKEANSNKKITKLEWNDKEYYGVMDGAILKLHKPDGKLYSWVISEGDMGGTDWVTL